MAAPLHSPIERGASTPGFAGGAQDVSRLALVACWLAIVVRGLLIIGFITIPLAYADYAVWEWIYVMVLAGCVALMGAYALLAFTLRCANCRRRFLVESRMGKHPQARRARPLGHWGTVVRDIVRQRQFVCMHCGALCRVR